MSSILIPTPRHLVGGALIAAVLLSLGVTDAEARRARNAVTGAAVGAGVGAVVDGSSGARTGAAVGAVVGAVQ